MMLCIVTPCWLMWMVYQSTESLYRSLIQVGAHSKYNFITLYTTKQCVSDKTQLKCERTGNARAQRALVKNICGEHRQRLI